MEYHAIPAGAELRLKRQEGNTMKRFISMMVVVLLLLSLVPAPAFAAENPVPKAKQAVVMVYSGIYYDRGSMRVLDSEGYYSRGTAFGVYSEGDGALVFATNAHVVSNDRSKAYDYVYICVDGADVQKRSTVVECEVLYVDTNVDVAIIRAEKAISGVGVLPLRKSEELETGDQVYALGYPGISDEIADENNYTAEDVTVTDGIISRFMTSEGVKCMAHTATVNMGNSGGPLIDAYGNAIGINSFIYVDTSTSDLRSYAIYSDYVMKAMDSLGFPYTQASGDRTVRVPTDASRVPSVLRILGIVVICTAAAVMVAAVVILLLRKRKKKLTQKKRLQGPPVTLFAVTGPLRGQVWQVGDEVIIGRNHGSTVLYPPDAKGVSRTHCRIHRQGPQILITDMGSSFGTYVGGRRLPPNVPVAIGINTEIWLGGDKVRLLLR